MPASAGGAPSRAGADRRGEAPQPAAEAHTRLNRLLGPACNRLASADPAPAPQFPHPYQQMPFGGRAHHTPLRHGPPSCMRPPLHLCGHPCCPGRAVKAWRRGVSPFRDEAACAESGSGRQGSVCPSFGRPCVSTGSGIHPHAAFPGKPPVGGGHVRETVAFAQVPRSGTRAIPPCGRSTIDRYSLADAGSATRRVGQGAVIRRGGVRAAGRPAAIPIRSVPCRAAGMPAGGRVRRRVPLRGSPGRG
ncbi:hypothetical protein HNP84_008756 [Thermocatellispora tengchongensis]|uniref:Uncharacterized protein n=1 Tax=Thermocatellispora tengchongensis TaxID=1073253 RepID=A0A840PC50_9ACTN|nr:hypothetical protein [Thermocatellispora tengchongensis]